MKKYHVNVNGNDYEIAIELLDQKSCIAAPKVSSQPEKTISHATKDNIEITSPMPGSILSINVHEGSMVKKGDILMILEAMKMENEILAPQDGKLVSLNITKGSTVESGTLLCTLV